MFVLFAEREYRRRGFVCQGDRKYVIGNTLSAIAYRVFRNRMRFYFVGYVNPLTKNGLNLGTAPIVTEGLSGFLFWI